jgi:hypothetical protein
MSDEILNIDHHTRILVEKALIRCNSLEHAAVLLGISTRTLYRYRVRYGLWNIPAPGKFLTTTKPTQYEHSVR